MSRGSPNLFRTNLLSAIDDKGIICLYGCCIEKLHAKGSINLNTRNKHLYSHCLAVLLKPLEEGKH